MDSFFLLILQQLWAPVSQDMQGTVGAAQRMVQNIGIAIYTAITSLFINNPSSSNKLIAGASEAWLFAAASLFIALLPFLLKNLTKQTTC